MSNTVAACVKPIEADAPQTELRTFTYPLQAGGSLTHPCPAWCVEDHINDRRDIGIHPSDLQHQTESISLDFDLFGGEQVGVLGAVIVQDPFSDGPPADPKALFAPISDDEPTAEQYLSAHQLGQVIDRIEAYVTELRKMQARLAEITAADHAAHVQRVSARPSSGGARPWESLLQEDVRSMPIAYLLQVFGGRVVEVDPFEAADQAARLSGNPGAIVIGLDRTLPQADRETVVRDLLVQLAAKVCR